MLPLLAIPADTRAMASITAEQTVTFAGSSTSSYAVSMSALSGSSWLTMRTPGSALWLDLSGRYGLALAMTPGMAPPKDLAATSRVRFDWRTTPFTTATVSSDGMLASRLGLRASNELAMRDPFLQSRVVYNIAGRAGFYSTTSPFSTVRFDAGYAQAGAVAADVAEAVGIDSHALILRGGSTHMVTRRFRLGPSFNASYTAFEHALLDVELNRGPVEIFSATGLGMASYEFSRTILTSAYVGLTVATPPPVVKNASEVVAPDIRLDARFLGHRFRGIATYSYAYTSLGPRIGFGMEHQAHLELWGRPVGGRENRNTIGRLVARFRYGETPLAMNPPLGLPPGAPQPTGNLKTTGVALGASLSTPLRLGFVVTGGLDLELISARITPVEPGKEPPPGFRGTLTLAISAIAATDPIRRLPRDPDLRDEDGYLLGGDGTDDERPRGRRAEEGKRGGEEGEDEDEDDNDDE